MILDDVPQVMFTVIEQQPDFPVCVGKKHLEILLFTLTITIELTYPLEVDHIDVLQFTQERNLPVVEHKPLRPKTVVRCGKELVLKGSHFSC